MMYALAYTTCLQSRLGECPAASYSRFIARQDVFTIKIKHNAWMHIRLGCCIDRPHTEKPQQDVGAFSLPEIKVFLPKVFLFKFHHSKIMLTYSSGSTAIPHVTQMPTKANKLQPCTCYGGLDLNTFRIVSHEQACTYFDCQYRY